ncbi:MAG: potassium channel family protein [Nakamurella sp.]
MHIVIMGCGRVGSSLAQALHRVGHSVAVIDRDETAFRRLGADFTGEQVLGVGFDRDTLLRSRITEAQAFAAVSSGDNSNIIAARVAREQFGVATVVARIYDAKRAQVYERLGIPTVATVPWTTDRLLRAIVPDALISEWRDPSGAGTIVNLPYHPAWAGRPLGQLEEEVEVRIALIVRYGKGLLPTEDTVIQDGDVIYAATLSGNTKKVAAQAAESPEEGA